MSTRFRAVGALLLFVLGPACAEVVAADDVDALARDVDRLVSVRAIKDLQRSYAHYEQFGRWDEMAGLFTPGASFIRGTETLSGRKAIADWLKRRGGVLNTELIDEPLVNLSADGQSAKARWMSMSFLADGKGNARIEGGLYENEYVRESQGWKISLAHYYPQYSGSYETGWSNEGGADLPLVPYHFTVDESGTPLPPPSGPAPRSTESLASLAQRIERLNDEDAVRNVQHAYGYYVDRKMWNDVVDLFADDARAGARDMMQRMGPAGLRQGELNDRPLFDTIVQVLPGGHEALSRGIELGLLGEADKGTAHWEITVFRNRFVKEDGVWKLKELKLHPVMRADYAKGWGSEGVVRYSKESVPPFLGVSPAVAVAKTAGNADQLAHARRGLARSMAYDGTENVSSAYGYYIDDFQWPQLGAIFAEKGNKQSPFAGYYMGRERITKAATTMWGTSSPARSGISYHWRTQLVVNVAADGRSANLRTRLFQPRTTKSYDASLFSGMYPNDQTVLENGIWKLWSLEIDEPYFTMAGWKGGWSGVKPKPPGSPRPPPSPLVNKFPPDILMTALGRRAEHFRGGTGETIEWPGILPMWFNYRNPVSGRVPELYWPDCVPCELMPESQMTRHGYLAPPTGPQKAEPNPFATPAITGVVKAGTPIQLVKDGFEAVEGPLPQSDDGLLFTNNRVGRIVSIAKDGAVSAWYQGAGGANALTRTASGEIAATLTESPAIGVVRPGEAPRVLVSSYEGTPFNRPNDLVANRRGDIYFTDTVPLTATKPAVMPSAVYELSAQGKLARIANDIARPNGVALSPDERTLYVANTSGEWVYAFELDDNGEATKGRRDFAKLALPPQPTGAMGGAGADGLAVDEKGRLYVATTIGVQVFSPQGAPLGTITLPRQPQNLAFAGPGRRALFVVGRGAVYRIDTLTRGPRRAGK